MVRRARKTWILVLAVSAAALLAVSMAGAGSLSTSQSSPAVAGSSSLGSFGATTAQIEATPLQTSGATEATEVQAEQEVPQKQEARVRSSVVDPQDLVPEGCVQQDHDHDDEAEADHHHPDVDDDEADHDHDDGDDEEADHSHDDDEDADRHRRSRFRSTALSSDDDRSPRVIAVTNGPAVLLICGSLDDDDTSFYQVRFTDPALDEQRGQFTYAWRLILPPIDEDCVRPALEVDPDKQWKAHWDHPCIHAAGEQVEVVVTTPGQTLTLVGPTGTGKQA